VSTGLFLALAVLAAMLLCSVTVALIALLGWWLQHRDDRQERRDHERRTRNAEHLAAQNGRPHTHAVIERAVRRP